MLLLPAIGVFLFAGYELIQHLAVLEQARIAGQPLPPTIYGEHSGLAIAAAALGLALTVVALRRGR